MISAFLGFAVAGCSGYFLASSKKGFEATELNRAAFDLNCPVDQIGVVELVAGSTPVTPDDVGKGGGNTVIGVNGCGRKATYKYVESIGWVAQTTSQQP